MKKIVILCIWCLAVVFVSGQQDQMYTQYMFNKMGLNPAFAGNENYTGITGIIRDQWNGFAGAPQAQMLSVNLPRIGEKIGIGFNFRRQTIGISKSTTYSGIYAYKFLFNNGTLSMGLEVSGRSLITDFSDPRLVATQGIFNDPSILGQKFTRNIINFGYGIYFNTNRYYIGASVPRIIKSDLDFDNNNYVSQEVRHLYVMAGFAWPVKRDLSLSVQSLFKVAENTPFDLDLSFSTTLEDKYTAGLSYRMGGADGDFGESIDLLISLQVTNQFMLGFSQDFTLSKIRKFDSGSLELIAYYALGKKKNRVIVVNPRYF